MDESPADDELILEGIVVTVNAAGQPNVAPMGPRVDRAVSKLTLRPFKTSATYRNLKETGWGVFHVTDDVLLLARAAVGALEKLPQMVAVAGLPCPRLADACRWWAFRVRQLDEVSERSTIDCQITAAGVERAFLGFNRAKHAVLEAAILATRLGIVPDEDIRRELERLTAPVEKTAGVQERAAFALVRDFIRSQLDA